MDYCPRNSSLAGILVGDINRCFIDTITDPLLLLVSLVAGLHQWRLYCNYSTPQDPSNIRHSKLYYIQLVLHFVLPAVSVGRFVNNIFGYGHPVQGVEILNLLTGTLPWISTGILLHLERGHQLPVSARQGHGPVLLIFWTLTFMQANVRLSCLTHEEWWHGFTDAMYILDFCFYVATYLFTCLIFVLGLKAPGLLAPTHYTGFGERMTTREEIPSGSAWSGFWIKIRKLLPYMWPKNSVSLQLRVIFCLLLLVGVRVTNVFVPIFYKKIVDALAYSSMDSSSWPWQDVTIWLVLKLLQGGGTGGQGLLNNWRSFLWIRVQQFTNLEIQISLLAHVHNLSLRWHLGRKTGEVLRVMDRGTSSVNNLLQYLIFNIIPTLVDITIAILYFGLEFNVYFGLIVFGTMAIYLGSTFAITEWRTKFRRRMNEYDNKQRARGVDSLLNAETVKYYSMESWEVQKYKEAIQQYQEMEWDSLGSLQLLNVFQSVVINGGLYAVSMYCAYLVSDHEHTVGDFVLLGTYFIQLMSPLNFLGTVYRMIQESFINMENMFTLMDEEVEVKDKPGAVEYTSAEAPPEIEFREVTFGYNDAKHVVDNISFTIAPGTSTAIVGPTGGGKSTLAKLLFRLFDTQEGGIYINNVNISDYTQQSYRSCIGVVPQDTVLFNDTVKYNIAYGRIGASIHDIEEACQMAEIHDTILGFPDGYDTVVGERGLKLSGGEKQRIAIARTLLKDPNVVIFDEATASLDTETERNIQESIDAVLKQRTSLIIAHRLSTVMRCDQILVLDHGRIVERGTHAELLQLSGKYSLLWNTQIQATKQSVDSSDLNDTNKY